MTYTSTGFDEYLCMSVYCFVCTCRISCPDIPSQVLGELEKLFKSHE